MKIAERKTYQDFLSVAQTAARGGADADCICKVLDRVFAIMDNKFAFRSQRAARLAHESLMAVKREVQSWYLKGGDANADSGKGKGHARSRTMPLSY